MATHWLMLIPSLVLLFFPLDILLPKNFIMRELRSLDFDRTGEWRRVPWKLPLLWLDVLRAFGGAWLLRHAWTAHAASGWNHAPVMASALILVVSFVAQMQTRRDADCFFAPLTHIVGLMLALAYLPVAILAIVAGGVCMVAFRSTSAFFFFAAVTVAILGHWVLHLGYWTMMVAILGLVPSLVSLMFRRPLALPIRRVGKEGRRRGVEAAGAYVSESGAKAA